MQLRIAVMPGLPVDSLNSKSNPRDRHELLTSEIKIFPGVFANSMIDVYKVCITIGSSINSSRGRVGTVSAGSRVRFKRAACIPRNFSEC